jgi:hypothetical protein
MNKRQFEEIENRIREAAENVSPPFSEEHWEEMNLLLDKEFPEKRRRRILFFWFWPLLGLAVAGGVFFSLNTNNNKRISSKEPDNKQIFNQSASDKSNRKNADDLTPGKGSGFTEVEAGSPKDNPATEIDASGTDLFPHANGAVNLSGQTKGPILSGAHRTPGTKWAGIKWTPLANDNRTDKNDNRTDKNEAGKNRNVLDAGQEDENKPSVTDQDNISAAVTDGKESQVAAEPLKKDSLTGNTIAADTVLKDQTEKSDTKKISPARISGFYFLAAGSFVNNSLGSLPSGTLSEEYGIGIGYRINRKLSVQTGLYAGKKKYKAGKDDYYFEPGSYYETVDSLKINADCYVLDIPVSIRYDFIQRPKYSFYGIAGVSSYIMKRETYAYSYSKSGTVHHAERTYTGNSHFLSIANISAGYERKLSPRFSILAEPYLKLPLSGVGAGKVKLHSTGILLGIKYNLASKRKLR